MESLAFILAQQDAGGGLMSTLIMFGVIFLIFWFLLIRPQKKEMQRHRELLAGLKVGDEVVTAGGLLGTVKSVDGPVIQIDIGRGTKIKISREKIQKKQEDFFDEADDNDDDDSEKDDD